MVAVLFSPEAKARGQLVRGLVYLYLHQHGSARSRPIYESFKDDPEMALIRYSFVQNELRRMVRDGALVREYERVEGRLYSRYRFADVLTDRAEMRQDAYA